LSKNCCFTVIKTKLLFFMRCISTVVYIMYVSVLILFLLFFLNGNLKGRDH
jgi:hypothetical protein